MNNLPVKIIRSPRRKKTISARVVGGELILRIPARMPKREEKEWVAKMREKIAKKAGGVPKSDEHLRVKAEKLNKRYFGGRLKINSIVFSNNQKKRCGSCNTLTGRIRISRRLTTMPEWVLDYIIIHELAHLVHADHSKAFWELVNQYRFAERARGFLIAKDMEEVEGAA
jgi:predicted metal-dependent hydrolase